MLTHLTLMPVCSVKAASASFGGAGAASVTVIVAPDVLSDPAELPEPPELPPPQAASAKASATAATTTVPPRRARVLLCVLANAPLLRYAAIAGSGRGQSLALAQSAARSDAHLRITCSTDHRVGILHYDSCHDKNSSRCIDLIIKRSYVHK